MHTTLCKDDQNAALLFLKHSAEPVVANLLPKMHPSILLSPRAWTHSCTHDWLELNVSRKSALWFSIGGKGGGTYRQVGGQPS